MLLLTLRGTPTIYYGDEIGMQQVVIPPDRVHDPVERNVPGLGLGRDGCRTPMQWNDTAHGGFSTRDPWLPLADSFRQQNVARQTRDEASIHWLYRRLIALRRKRPALVLGSFRPIVATGDLLLFVRQYHAESLLIALNLGNASATASLPKGANGAVLLSTHIGRDNERVTDALPLGANEGIVIELAPGSLQTDPE
jgi:alpha-glucosidase